MGEKMFLRSGGEEMGCFGFLWGIVRFGLSGRVGEEVFSRMIW